MKNSLRYRLGFLLILLTVAVKPVQSFVGEADKKQAQTSPDDNHSTEANDPAGRSTPHGTVIGFLQAAQNGKYKAATQYLQLSKNERATKGERIAHQLHELMDTSFVGRVGTISDNREGSAQSDVPADHERIGIFRTRRGSLGRRNLAILIASAGWCSELV
jgi:hypothetical protein